MIKLWRRLRKKFGAELYECKHCGMPVAKNEMIIDKVFVTALDCPNCKNRMASDVCNVADWSKTPKDFHLFYHNQTEFANLLRERRNG